MNGECRDLLQISGFEARSTGGGTATSELRTVYAYRSEEPYAGVPPGYSGTAWPYGQTDPVDGSYTITCNYNCADLSFSISSSDVSENHLRVNGQYLYQYTGDQNVNDVNGLFLDNWAALDLSGEQWGSSGGTPAPTPAPTPEPTPAPTPAPTPEQHRHQHRHQHQLQHQLQHQHHQHQHQLQHQLQHQHQHQNLHQRQPRPQQQITMCLVQ